MHYGGFVLALIIRFVSKELLLNKVRTIISIDEIGRKKLWKTKRVMLK
ncbi:hypothetical protein DOT_3784 [Desulfosporosinus sp. OT]|nr:hypothetical protein DOT_3784 [Desulfosporosinus sp. OT]